MEAAVDLEISPSSDWTGIYSWDSHLLRLHITMVKPDYDRDDPRTWPLIKNVCRTERELEIMKEEFPAVRLAYDQGITDYLRLLPPLKKTRWHLANACPDVSIRFAGYPFNFDKEGVMRRYPHIPKAEYDEWMQLFGKRSADKPAVEKDAQPQESGQATTESAEDISPQTAYEQIIKTFADTQHSTSTTISNLELELTNTKNACSIQVRRAELAERKVEHIRAFYKIEMLKGADRRINGFNKELQSYRDRISEQKAVAQAALASLEVSRQKVRTTEEQVGQLQTALVERQSELEIARKETAQANEKIMAVWTEVHKGKRKAGDEGAGGQGKKVKM